MDQLYSFVYRGILTDESLDKAGRQRRSHLGSEDLIKLRKSLSFEMLDIEMLEIAKAMSIAYCAIHTFENMVRSLVKKVMTESHGAEWWQHVPEKIKSKVKTRMEEDAKFRWHGARGGAEISYCDFGDLSSIIVTNFSFFESIISEMEWAKGVLNTLEKSRNIIMHGGILAKEDIERIGMNIRDWIRQTG